MGYKERAKGQGLDGTAGFYIKRAGMPHRTSMPTWQKEFRFRVFPMPHASGQGFMPMRKSMDDNDFSDAVHSEDVVRRFGPNVSITAITTPGDKDGNPIRDGSVRSPIEMASETLIDMCENHVRECPEAWDGWHKGRPGKGAVIGKPKGHVFWQGAVIMSGDKLLTNAAKQPAPAFPSLIMAATSVQIAFERMGNTRIELPNGQKLPKPSGGDDQQSRTNDDAIYAQSFKLGDWCSIGGGRLISLTEAEKVEGETFSKYELTMLDPYPLDSIVDKVVQSFVPFEQLLRYLTVEQQVAALVQALPPEAVDHVFARTEFESMLPAHVQGAWKRFQDAKARGVAGMDVQTLAAQMSTGAPPPQQPPQQQPPQQPQQQPQQQLPPQPQPAVYVPPQQPPAPSYADVAQGQAPPPQPQQTAAPTGVDLSGGGLLPEEQQEEPPAPPMGQGAFAETPPEFQQPLPPQQPPANVPPGTPPAAVQGAALDPDELARTLANLEAGRQQAAQGTQQPPQG